MGADFGDYDNDGFLDLVVPNFQREPTSLYRNEGDGLFAYESTPSGIGRYSLLYVGWSTAFFDYDNDGLLDIFVANGHTLDNVILFDASTSYPSATSCSGTRGTDASPRSPTPRGRAVHRQGEPGGGIRGLRQRRRCGYLRGQFGRSRRPAAERWGQRAQLVPSQSDRCREQQGWCGGAGRTQRGRFAPDQGDQERLWTVQPK